MSTATAGRAREYRVRDLLAGHGWVQIMRAAASKGPADLLLACPARGPILVQVGTAQSKSLGPSDRARFVTAADMCRATPVLATTSRAGVEYRRVTLDVPSIWPVWDPDAHYTSNIFGSPLPLTANELYADNTTPATEEP